MIEQIKLYKEDTGKDPYISVAENHGFTSLPSWDYVEWLEKRAAESSGAQPAHAPNTQSSTCRCELKGPHFQSKTGDRVTAVSLSLEVNKECPIHGHYFG
jgi:hypothetical protein